MQIAAAGCLCAALLTACSKFETGGAEAADPGTPFLGEVQDLSAAEAAALEDAFAGLFPLSADGLRFEDPDCGDVHPTVEPVDLDRDGSREAIVQWGNTCTSGMAGWSVSLFIRTGGGIYRDQFGFPGLISSIADSEPGSFPDIEIGGPGFCFAVWGWDGDSYAFKCNAPQEAGGCEFQGNVCP
jgi:hypothetical protein